MGWMYMVVCTADFVVFPVLWGLLQTIGGGKVETQWMPITLQGAGLFHIAMGAILGIAAYGRTQEKLGGANNGGLQSPNSTPSFGAPVGNGGFASPTTTPSFSAPKPAASFAPKPAAAPLAPVTGNVPLSAPVADTHTNFDPSYAPSGSYKPSTDPRALSVIDYDDHDDEPDLTRAK